MDVRKEKIKETLMKWQYGWSVFCGWVPVVLIASIIFWSSSQPYEKQDIRPFILNYVSTDFVVKEFSDVSFTYAGNEVSIEALGVDGFMEFFIRKGAHFTVFFFLAYFTYRALRIQGVKIGHAFMYALFFTVVYAISDEVHQAFTTNRTALLADVVLDSIGGFCGIVIRSLKK
jgi:hypothetical protein